ncbi:transport and Golgi organization 2-like [Melia azedarach]|uniref:Transport and Golgi organization 2-like n=1 Tax=Melia azedarach TaxID=155640 RepID=A0ACC1XY12_MELAZ|nr:transport and Golgi organization 2-like [Melia azedarach]
MCIAVFMWEAHPAYPFLLFLNRDEYHRRPTKALGWWEGGEILGGRDEEAGGTWLACTKDGKFAFLTNFREVQSIPQAKSRGELPVRFLQSKKKPMDFAEEFVKKADQYNGFNLLIADIHSKSMVYITNRSGGDKTLVTEVSPGIHVLTNAALNSPWPKAQRLVRNFKELMKTYSEGEFPMKEMVDKLMMDTTKVNDESLLPHIYSPATEYSFSSIFIDTERPLGRYGTRSTSALHVKSSGEVYFYEKHLEKDLWKEKTVTYQIEK